MEPTPGNLLGPMLLGSFFSCVLYGVFLVQVCMYFHGYKQDSAMNRYMIIYLLIMETISAVLTCGVVYEPLIMKFGKEEALRVTPKLLSADGVLTVLISTPVQMYFAWRLRSATDSWIIPSMIIFFSLSSLAGGVTTTAAVTLLPLFSQFEDFKPAVITWLFSAALADIWITIGLVLFLRAGRAGFTLSDTLLNRIILLTVQTGAITSFAAILDAGVFLGVKGTTLMFIWDFSISKLYANCFLSTLNARAGWNRLIDSQRRKTLIPFIDVDGINITLDPPSWAAELRAS